jgi:peptidoglycan/xylan/chitin deacetylase (PgdA/CDA1 family)
MTGDVRLSVRASWSFWLGAALCLGLATSLAAPAALAADCPRPDALGTSRTLVVDAKAHPLIGTMQYRETLPLNEGEVVLTFDDGPLPKHSNQILEILAAQCVKATFFMVGRQAQANPEGVRKVRDAGHTVATHSQSHPAGMHRLAIERAKAEIDEGIANVTAALGEGGAAVVSPFFRIPGLARNDAIEEYTRAQGLQIWSADFPADDWRHVSSARVYDLALSRLAAKGKGILLLHDIQARTVAALPKILHELKARGYRIVHVVPATPDLPATPTESQQWLLNPSAEAVAALRWPKIPSFAFAQEEPLPAPLLTDSYWNDLAVFGEPQRRRGGVPLPRQGFWPRQVELASIEAASALPVPAAALFDAAEALLIPAPATAAVIRREQPRVAAQEKAERPAKRVAARNAKPARVAAVAHARRAVVERVKPGRAASPASARTAAKRALPDKKNVKRAIRHNQEASL